MMDASDVVCMTEDEAEAVTGLRGAEAQAHWVLGRPGARTEWCVVKRGAEGAVLASRSCGADAPVFRQQALRVDVRDTGGCGAGRLSSPQKKHRCRHGMHGAHTALSCQGFDLLVNFVGQAQRGTP